MTCLPVSRAKNSFELSSALDFQSTGLAEAMPSLNIQMDGRLLSLCMGAKL